MTEFKIGDKVIFRKGSYLEDKKGTITSIKNIAGIKWIGLKMANGINRGGQYESMLELEEVEKKKELQVRIVSLSEIMSCPNKRLDARHYIPEHHNKNANELNGEVKKLREEIKIKQKELEKVIDKQESMEGANIALDGRIVVKYIEKVE